MDRLEEIRQRVEQLVRIANNPYCLGPAALLDGVKEIVPALLSEVDRLEKGWQEALALANTNAKLFDEATARAEAAEAERDAAVKDMTEMAKCRLLGTCTFCKHRNTPDARYKPCKGCEQPNGSRKNFEWRGQAAGKGKNDGNQ